jgi:hypothetical protein
LQLYFPAGIDDKALALFRQIEADGIGERLQEGYGRVAFVRMPSDLKYPEGKQEADVLKKPAEKLPETVVKLFSSIVRERLASYLVISAIKNSQAFEAGCLPTTSLLGKLELILRNSEEEDTFIKSLNLLTDPARKSLEGCHNRRQTLLQALKTISPDALNEMWEENPEAQRLNVEAGLDLLDNPEFRFDMYRLYTLEFIRGIRRLSKIEGRKAANA